MDTQHQTYEGQDLLGVVNGQPLLRYKATGDKLIAANDQHMEADDQTGAASLAATSADTL